jgi:hypothetical protein
MTRTTTMMMVGLAAVTAGAGCRRLSLDDPEQVGNAAGEVMASLDESADGRVTAAMNRPASPFFRAPDELRGPLWRRALDSIEGTAYAASCFPSTFSACAAGVRTRTFAQCSIGGSTLDGAVTLTFTRPATCALLLADDAVTRTADFTLTGPYGGTLTVSSPGGGQTLTKTAAGFEYGVAGMERVLKGPGGRTLFDVSTHTTAPFVVTGSSRADLVIVSGTLEVVHNVAKYSVSLTADHLAWAPTCNCAVSGSLTGTVSGGGKHDGKSASVKLTGCGKAEVTIDGETDDVVLDRCGAI